MANKSDIFPGSFGQYDLSLFWIHGDKQIESLEGKGCVNDITNKGIAFLYSHREKFNPQDKKQRQVLAEHSNNCISVDDNISILDYFENKRSHGIEQDKLVDNGSSSAYGYLINIDG